MTEISTTLPGVRLRPATEEDVPTILHFIESLAAYEKLSHAVVANAELLRSSLFGERPAAEVMLAEADGQAAGFALFFSTYSTFLARPGMYLEDLFVLPEFRGRGIGTALLAYLARVAVDRGYGRFEWAVLNWNEPAIRVYRGVGAEGMDEWTVQRVAGDALTALAKRFDDEFDG